MRKSTGKIPVKFLFPHFLRTEVRENWVLNVTILTNKCTKDVNVVSIREKVHCDDVAFHT